MAAPSTRCDWRGITPKSLPNVMVDGRGVNACDEARRVEARLSVLLRSPMPSVSVRAKLHDGGGSAPRFGPAAWVRNVHNFSRRLLGKRRRLFFVWQWPGR